jgi:hypothetical protein
MTAQTTLIPHFIDGRRTAGRSAPTADVLNPSTGQLQAQVAKNVSDPYTAVQVDVAALRSAADLPNGMRCVGMVYDVGTGLGSRRRSAGSVSRRTTLESD